MSKAFTREETVEEPALVRARAPLPPGVPNYVTARGLKRLRHELSTLEGDLQREQARTGADDPGTRARLAALTTRLTELHARINGAVLVPPAPEGDGEIRFGATVTVRDAADHERTCTIVGVDEADARAGLVAFVSPLARALLGRRLGQSAIVTTPRGEEEVEVRAIRYDDAP